MEGTVFVLLLLLNLCHSNEVFHVKSANNTGDCLTPCHFLQYYADHSSFTNNSMFLFLEGEHFLESTLILRNVANLSLVGVSSRVIITGVSGFLHVQDFAGLILKNLVVSNSSGIVFQFSHGSEVSLSSIVVPNHQHLNPEGLNIVSVTGAISIFNSTFNTTVAVTFSFCNNQSSVFEFSNNTVRGTHSGVVLGITCPNVRVVIMYSTFEDSPTAFTFGTFMNNSLQVISSLFLRSTMDFLTCFADNCDKSGYINCNHNAFTFNDISVVSSNLSFEIDYVNNCTIFVEDSRFSQYSMKIYNNVDRIVINSNLTPGVIKFCNVTFSGAGNVTDYSFSLSRAFIVCANCSFDSIRGPAIHASQDSVVIFEGNNVFTNNRALVGAGIHLTRSSSMNLEPFCLKETTLNIWVELYMLTIKPLNHVSIMIH